MRRKPADRGAATLRTGGRGRVGSGADAIASLRPGNRRTVMVAGRPRYPFRTRATSI